MGEVVCKFCGREAPIRNCNKCMDHLCSQCFYSPRNQVALNIKDFSLSDQDLKFLDGFKSYGNCRSCNIENVNCYLDSLSKMQGERIIRKDRLVLDWNSS